MFKNNETFISTGGTHAATTGGTNGGGTNNNNYVATKNNSSTSESQFPLPYWAIILIIIFGLIFIIGLIMFIRSRY